MHTRRLAVLGTLAAASCAAAWYALSGPGDPALPEPSRLHSAQLEPLARWPAFTLDAVPQPVTAQSLRGHWNFVYFGYTSCPDACPTTLALLGRVNDGLRARALEPPAILFVSIDPQRDTPAVLQRYAAAFGTQVTGATADAAHLEPLLRFFGATYERRDGGTFDHTPAIFLVTPDGRWLATFSPLADADAVLADTALLLGAR